MSTTGWPGPRPARSVRSTTRRLPTATVTGTTNAEAMRAITVGESTAPRLTLTGEERPPKHPHVAAALHATTIGTLAAGAIVSLLDRVELRADAEALDAMEKTLVEAAHSITKNLREATRNKAANIAIGLI